MDVDKELEKMFPTKGWRKIMRNVRSFFRSLKYSVKNIVRWWKIIWNDRDWDYGFLEDIIFFKLKTMRDYYRAGVNVWSEGADETADEIDEVIQIFERLRAGQYEETIDPNFYDRFRDKRELFIEKIDDSGQKYSTLNLPDFTDEERKDRRITHQTAEQMRQSDYDEAFSLIAKNIRKWWD